MRLLETFALSFDDFFKMNRRRYLIIENPCQFQAEYWKEKLQYENFSD